MDIKRIVANVRLLCDSQAFEYFLYGDLDEEEAEPYNRFFEEIDQLSERLPEDVFVTDLENLYCGNARTHVYGKATCNATQGHLILDQKTQDRVLFNNIEDAEAAGYRPCGKCMHDKYIEWKNKKMKV